MTDYTEPMTGDEMDFHQTRVQLLAMIKQSGGIRRLNENEEARALGKEAAKVPEIWNPLKLSLKQEAEDEGDKRIVERWIAQITGGSPKGMAITGKRLTNWFTGKRLPPRRCVLTDMFTDDPNGAPFLIRGKTAMLAAPGGTGKTGVLTQMAIAVASGGAWFDLQAEEGKVLLLLGEEDEEEIQRRMRNIYEGLELSDEKKEELLPKLQKNLVAMPGYSMDLRLQNEEYGTTYWFEQLKGYLEEQGPWALIIIDPASRFMGSEAETDNAAATRFMELLEELTKVNGEPALLFAHHTNKGELSKNLRDTDQGGARGSSAITDGARWQANMVWLSDHEELPDEWRQWRALKVVKSNYTPRGRTIVMKPGKGGVMIQATREELAERQERVEELKVKDHAKDSERKKKAKERSERKPGKGYEGLL